MCVCVCARARERATSISSSSQTSVPSSFQVVGPTDHRSSSGGARVGKKWGVVGRVDCKHIVGGTGREEVSNTASKHCWLYEVRFLGPVEVRFFGDDDDDIIIIIISSSSSSIVVVVVIINTSNSNNDDDDNNHY